MIGLRAFDLLGLFIAPAAMCLAAGVAVSYVLRRIFDRVGINRFVWNRALFDFGVLIAVTALLILTLRFPGP